MMVTVPEHAGRSNVLEPIPKGTLADRVVLILKRFILMENLGEGDSLPSERELAAALDVSHRVVREALGLLVGEGLIVKHHGRGAFVQAFDREQLIADLLVPAAMTSVRPSDLHKARCAIEIGAMYLVAEYATEEEIAQLQNILETMKRKLAAGASISVEDLAFHQTLLRATHNDTLQAFSYLIAESVRLAIYDQPALLRRSIRDESPVVEAHEAVLKAIQARDGEKASLAMRFHLRWLLQSN